MDTLTEVTFSLGDDVNNATSSGPFPGNFAGGVNLRATFRNVKRKTKGLPYNMSKIGNP